MNQHTYEIKQDRPNFGDGPFPAPAMMRFAPCGEPRPVMVLKKYEMRRTEGYGLYRVYPLDGGRIGYDIETMDAEEWQLEFVDSIVLNRRGLSETA